MLAEEDRRERVRVPMTVGVWLVDVAMGVRFYTSWTLVDVDLSYKTHVKQPSRLFILHSYPAPAPRVVGLGPNIYPHPVSTPDSRTVEAGSPLFRAELDVGRIGLVRKTELNLPCRQPSN